MDAGDKFSSTFAIAMALVIVLGLASLVGIPIFKSITADGKVEYCYVENERTQVPNQPDVVLYQLYGFRPWRSDRRLAVNLPSLEAAKVEADRIGCPMK